MPDQIRSIVSKYANDDKELKGHVHDLRYTAFKTYNATVEWLRKGCGTKKFCFIDEVLKWAGVDEGKPPKKVVDVGCGIGGSSRHIVKKYDGSTAQGLTLSPYQANRGNELAKEQGLSDRASFQVRLRNAAIFCNNANVIT